MLRYSLVSLMFFAALAHAGSLSLGVVLEQDEALTDQANTQRYRAFVKDVEKSVGQPVRLQFYKRGFTAIKDAKEGSLDMVFGPSQVIANISKFGFEPILKSDEMTAAAFVASPSYKGTLSANNGARLGVPDYESLMGGLARSEINNRGLAKSDFSEIKFHRMADAPLFGLKLGRYDLAVASAEEAKAWTATNGGRILYTSSPVPLRAMSVQTDKVPAGAQQKLALGHERGHAERAGAR